MKAECELCGALVNMIKYLDDTAVCVECYDAQLLEAMME